MEEQEPVRRGGRGRGSHRKKTCVLSIADEFYEASPLYDEESPQSLEDSPLSPGFVPRDQLFTPSPLTGNGSSGSGSGSTCSTCSYVEVRPLMTPPMPPAIPQAIKETPPRRKQFIDEESEDEGDAGKKVEEEEEDFSSVKFFEASPELPKRGRDNGEEQQQQQEEEDESESESDEDKEDEEEKNKEEGYRMFLTRMLNNHVGSFSGGSVIKDKFFEEEKSHIFTLINALFFSKSPAEELMLFKGWLDTTITANMVERGNRAKDSKQYTDACFFYMCGNLFKEASAMAVLGSSPYLGTITAGLGGSAIPQSACASIGRKVLEVTKSSLACLGFHFWLAANSEGADSKDLSRILSSFFSTYNRELQGYMCTVGKDDEYGGNETEVIFDFLRYYATKDTAQLASFLSGRRGADCVILWVLSTLMNNNMFRRMFGGIDPVKNCLRYLGQRKDLFEWMFYVMKVEKTTKKAKAAAATTTTAAADAHRKPKTKSKTAAVAAAADADADAETPKEKAKRLKTLKRMIRFLRPEQEEFLIKNELFTREEIGKLKAEYEHKRKNYTMEVMILSTVNTELCDKAVMRVLRANLPEFVLNSSSSSSSSSRSTKDESFARFLDETKHEYVDGARTYLLFDDKNNDGSASAIPENLEKLKSLEKLVREWHKVDKAAGSAEGIVLNMMTTRLVECAVALAEKTRIGSKTREFASGLARLPLSVSARASLDSSLIKK